MFAYSGVQHILCFVLVLFFFVLCTICFQFLWIVHFWLSLWYSLTFILYWCYIYWYSCLTVTNILSCSLFQHYRFIPCSVLYTGNNWKSLPLKFRNGSKKLWKYKIGTFIILLFTLQLLDSVFKHNCGIKKFEKIMVNKCPYIEFTKLLWQYTLICHKWFTV